MYRTYEELLQVVKQDKPLKVIKTVFEDVQMGMILQDYIDELKSEYEEKYGECNDCLVYIDVIKKPVLDENGFPVIDEETGEEKYELEYVFPEDFYELVEDENGETKKVLREDVAEKLAEGKIKPDLDKWIEWHLNGKEELDLEPFIPECPNCDEEFIKFIKPYLLDKLAKLADEKQEQAEALIAEKKKISDKQIQRYKTKYELAQQAKANNDYSAFELEAKLVGMTAEDLVNLILTNGENWKKAIDNFIIMIEAYRVRAQKSIQEATTINQIFTIERLFEVAKTMGPGTKPEDIEALFTEYSEA